MNRMGKKLYPLSEPQKRIWLTQMLCQDSLLYNIGGYVHFDGDIDVEILRKSIIVCIHKFSALRIKITKEDNEYYQYFDGGDKIQIRILDFTQHGLKEFVTWAQNELMMPFALYDNYLFEFAVAEIGNHQSAYFIKLHHVIADGWSIQLLTDEVMKQYDDLIHNRVYIPDGRSSAYESYLESEKEYLNSTRYCKNQKFWKKQLEPYREGISQVIQKTEGKRKHFYFTKEQSEEIQMICKRNHLSLNVLFISLFILYRYLRYREKKTITGIPFVGRMRREEQKVFGMMVSTIPFTFTMDENESLIEMANRIQDDVTVCIMNSKYPYNHMLHDFKEDLHNHAAFFNSSVNYYNTKIISNYGDVKITNVELYCGEQDFSLQLILRDWMDGPLQLDMDYNIAIYKEYEVDDLFHMLQRFMMILQENGQMRVLDCCKRLVEEEKRKLVWCFNQTDVEYMGKETVVDLFRRQVKINRDKIAILCEDKSLTYGELYEKATALATYLRRKGVTADTLVGMVVELSMEAVIGILAILIAGGAFLCINPKFPAKRKLYMIQDSAISCILSNVGELEDELKEYEAVDLKDATLYQESECVDKFPSILLNQLAYIIYTSGTSGYPKGVMIEHQDLTRYIQWACKKYVKDNRGDFALFTSLSFDLTITSIFVPLICGCKIVVYPECQSGYILDRIIEDNQVDLMKATPTHLSLLKSEKHPDSRLHTIIVGGEQLMCKVAKRVSEIFDGRVTIYNEYGPTEATVGCMIYKYQHEVDIQGAVPIGKPADQMKIYLLDDKGRPVLLNQPGRLFISGKHLSRGYRNQEELNQKRFLKNPFEDGLIMYDTGDIAKFISLDCIEYIKRDDHQVKINGNRIEIDEIRMCILKYPLVRDTFVAVYQDDTECNHLVAYVVTEKDILEHRIQSFLLEYLPEYMIPEQVIRIETIPMKLTGKIDMDRLPKPNDKVFHNTKINDECDNENVIIRVMEDVLKVFNLNASTNYYHIGGDSIRAILISNKISNLGFYLKASDILANPVIKDMAFRMIRNRGNDKVKALGDVEPSPMMVYFRSLQLRQYNYYNQSVTFQVHPKVKIEQIKLAIHKLCQVHDILRARYDNNAGQLCIAESQSHREDEVTVYDLRYDMPSTKGQVIARICTERKATSMIDSEGMIKFIIFRKSDEETILFITAHHLIVDGISWGIICDDLNQMLGQLIKNQELSLSEEEISYKEWASNVYQYWTRNYIVDKQHEFIVDYTNGEKGKWCHNKLDTYDECGIINFDVNQDMSNQIIEISKSEKKINEVHMLMYALIMSCKKVWDMDQYLMDMEWHGRNERISDGNLSRTIGWFTCITPLVIDHIASYEDMDNKIAYIKTKVNESRRNTNDYQFQYWYYEKAEHRNSMMKFNYLGDYRSVFQDGLLNYVSMDTGRDVGERNQLEYPIEINITLFESKLSVNINYCKTLFREVDIVQLKEAILMNLQVLVDYLNKSNQIYMVPSDYETVDLRLEEFGELFN